MDVINKKEKTIQLVNIYRDDKSAVKERKKTKKKKKPWLDGLMIVEKR